MNEWQWLDDELVRRGRRFDELRQSGEGAPLQALSLEVTRRCIARCVMCNIWKTARDLPELSVPQWLHVLSSPVLHDLREIDVTGGEPFLRDDLGDLLSGVAALRRSRLGELRSVAITTNGFLTAAVLATIREAASVFEEAGLELILACAMDGIGPIHDGIRRYRGGWKRLDATVGGLVALRERHPNLVLGIKMTISHLNVDQVDAVAAYADERGLFTIMSPYIVAQVRYGNLGIGGDLPFSAEDLVALKAFYEGDRFQWSYYRDELRRFLDEGVMRKPCSAGFNYAFIRSTDDVYPCPLIDPCLGNILERPLGDILDSPEARAFRRGIGDYPACLWCTEPGLERYALAFEGWHYLQLLRDLGPDRFRALHAHLGLAKYFPELSPTGNTSSVPVP